MPGRPLECQLDHRLPTTSLGESRGHCVGSPASRFVACASPTPPQATLSRDFCLAGEDDVTFSPLCGKWIYWQGLEPLAGTPIASPPTKHTPWRAGKFLILRSFNWLKTQGLTRWLADLGKSLNFSEPQFP